MSGPTKFEILQIIEMRISVKPYSKWVISDNLNTICTDFESTWDWLWM